MVKKTEKAMKKIKFGFSLTETMILITILAIAVAAMTPIISRKIINTTEAGTTLSGGAHGRYEIYAKEIVTFGGDSYEKMTDPSGPGTGGILGGAGSSILVFRRLDDVEYTQEAKHTPALSSDGKRKATLYEQISDAKPYRDASGQINYVEFKDPRDQITKKFPVGGNIIVESADVVYKKGKIEAGPPQSFKENTGLGAVTLPNAKNRIIEGNLTEKYKDNHSISKNPMWHIDCDSSGFDGDVTVIPWERLISGNTPIIDRPVPQNPDTGEYIGSFNPGENAKNIVIHAVGGGGAGGGLGNPGKAVSPKTADAKQLQEMKEDLAKRFREITGAKTPTNDLVKVVNSPDFYKKKYNAGGVGDNSAYIFLNQYDGTITVKVDVRIGKYQVFPHQLLDYTKVLGSQIQDSIVYDMPKWGDWDTIYNRGFYAAAVGCGCAGGKGADYTWTESVDYYCKRNKLCPDGPSSSYCEASDTGCKECVACCSGAAAKIDYSKLEKDFGITGFASAAKLRSNLNLIARYEIWSGGGSPSTGSSSGTSKAPSCSPSYRTYTSCIQRECSYKCDQNHYYRSQIELHPTGSCSAEAVCPTNSGAFQGKKYTHSYLGGAGGAAPPCAVACIRIKQPVDVLTNCDGSCPGISGANKAFTGGESGVASGLQSGQMGRTCFPRAGGNLAASIGGGGGTPCVQMKATADIGYDSSLLLDAMKDCVPGVSSSFSIGPDGVGVTMIGASAEVVASNVAISEGSLGDVFTISQQVSSNDIETNWLCEAMPSKGVCGVAGAKGTATNNCADPNLYGINSGAEGRYNHIYTWTIPYSINSLTYGEAGEAGEYKTTKLSKVTGPLSFIIGKGGVWEPNSSDSEPWANSKKGPDGEDTIVKMDGKNILVAKGGKGGKQSLVTDKYDLCYPVAGQCAQRDSNDIVLKDKNGKEIVTNCCNSEKGTRSTKDIITTASNMSAFENIKSLVGNSTIIGIGLGRGGEGSGTRAGLEETPGQRAFVNSSGYGVNYPQASIDSTLKVVDYEAKLEDYENKAVAPSELNFKGGDGAVIVTW